MVKRLTDIAVPIASEERAILIDMCKAHDREDSAQRGELDPWTLTCEDTAEWEEERIYAMREALRAYRATMVDTTTMRSQFVAWATGQGMNLEPGRGFGDVRTFFDLRTEAAWTAWQAAFLSSSKGRGEGWRTDTAPQNGTEIIVRFQHSYRFTLYKPTSQQRKRGQMGRWQRAAPYMGWENCDAPTGMEWKPARSEPSS